MSSATWVGETMFAPNRITPPICPARLREQARARGRARHPHHELLADELGERRRRRGRRFVPGDCVRAGPWSRPSAALRSVSAPRLRQASVPELSSAPALRQRNRDSASIGQARPAPRSPPGPGLRTQSQDVAYPRDARRAPSVSAIKKTEHSAAEIATAPPKSFEVIRWRLRDRHRARRRSGSRVQGVIHRQPGSLVESRSARQRAAIGGCPARW